MTIIGAIMAYTFGSGIKFAAPIWALAALGMTSAADAASGMNVDVTLSGLRNAKGVVLVCLATNPKSFPDCSKDPGAQKKSVPAQNGSSVRFTGVTPGSYAIAVIHDENNNGKMDMSLFLPKEGWGLSRNPKTRMGKPKFANSAFLVTDKNLSFSVTMEYMF
jgi:uncharacterized protein (DUF2141 family)